MDAALIPPKIIASMLFDVIFHFAMIFLNAFMRRCQRYCSAYAAQGMTIYILLWWIGFLYLRFHFCAYYQAGFLWSGRAGAGLVVAKLPDGIYYFFVPNNVFLIFGCRTLVGTFCNRCRRSWIRR